IENTRWRLQRGTGQPAPAEAPRGRLLVPAEALWGEHMVLTTAGHMAPTVKPSQTNHRKPQRRTAGEPSQANHREPSEMNGQWNPRKAAGGTPWGRSVGEPAWMVPWRAVT